MTEKKSIARALIKIVVFTILACIGFFVLFGISFIYVFALTLNVELSLLLGLLISAVTMFTLVTILRPSRSRVALSRRQMIGVYVVLAAIFVLSLPLVKINCLLFLSWLPSFAAVTFIVIYETLRVRNGKEMAQK